MIVSARIALFTLFGVIPHSHFTEDKIAASGAVFDVLPFRLAARRLDANLG